MFKKILITLVLISQLVFASTNENRIIDLSKYEKKVTSQNGEDGVIEAIFSYIGKRSTYYVEFGTQDGSECNTRCLRNKGWKGLLMDGDFQNSKINLHKEWITSENINSLFEKHHVPRQIDLLSIDIDYNDFYVWQAISRISPRVVVIEYNSTHLPHEDKVVLESPGGGWDGSNYFGASILALYNLGRSKGYSLVYAEKNGVNLFFVRDDVLQKLAASKKKFQHVNNVNAIYRPPGYGSGPNGGHTADAYNRPYLTSKEIMQRELHPFDSL